MKKLKSISMLLLSLLCSVVFFNVDAYASDNKSSTKKDVDQSVSITEVKIIFHQINKKYF